MIPSLRGEAAVKARNVSARLFGEVFLLLLGLFCLCLSWWKDPLPLGDFLLKNSGECIFKVLFITLIFWGKFQLFAGFRSKTYLVMGFFGVGLMRISFYLYTCFPVADWSIFALDIAEFAIVSFFCAIVIEFTFAVLDQILRVEKPFNCQLSFFSQRLLARERALLLMGRVMVYYTALLLCGLHLLNTAYLFNWFFFSHSGAFLLLTAVLTTTARFEQRLQKACASQLFLVDEKIEALLHSMETNQGAWGGVEVGVLIELRKELVSTGKIPWGWRQVVLMIGCVGSLLAQPYLYQAMIR